MAFPRQRFYGCFAHQMRMIAALKGSVIQDELIEAKRFPGDRFARIQIRFKSAVKVLDHRTAAMG